MDAGRISPEMGGMKQGTEVPVGLHLEEVDAGKLHEYRAAIKSMQFNALDTSKNYALQAAREDDVNALFHEYLAPGTHGALFVAKDGERLAGFVALTLHPDTRTATVNDIWLDEKHHQAPVVAEILTSAEDYLRAHDCEHATLRAPSASEALLRVANRFEESRFYSIEEEDGERHDLEKAA